VKLVPYRRPDCEGDTIVTAIMAALLCLIMLWVPLAWWLFYHGH
jgi:hypothetical protein